MLQAILTRWGFDILVTCDGEEAYTAFQQNETLKHIESNVYRIGELTRRIMKITRYQTKPYLKSMIVDIERASLTNNEIE